jgi:hypothetical protein
MNSTIEKGVGVEESTLPWVDIAVRPGYKQRYQGFYDTARRLGLRIGSLYADPYYMSPRHRHTFQQVRFLVEGKMRYGKEIYSVGDCLYIPEGAYYGPITPVAVKDGGTEQMHFVDIQFEGPSGIPYPHPDAVVDAQRALTKKGTFEEGIYTPDSGRKRDAYEAILEELTGQPVKYPPSRLDTYVVMRSNAFPWMEVKGLKGVSQRQLGYYFECGPNIKMLSIKAGASLPVTTPDGHRAMFLLSGKVNFDGEEFNPLSYFVVPDGVPCAAVRAEEDSEFLAIGWTTPGKTVPLDFY